MFLKTLIYNYNNDDIMTPRKKERSSTDGTYIRVPKWLHEEINQLKHEMKTDSMWEAIAKLVEEHEEMEEIEHINTYADHFTLAHHGRIFNVYIRWKGNQPFLWCELDESSDCVHVKYIFSKPKLRKALFEIIEKGHTDPVD
ncbi:hypothetical protein ABOONEI_2469 [Aciduliprofundum boonei T469]|nr:hypothetical protein ABOONEI_2469 [Aciduliprofundum boonei T469]